MLNSKGMGQLGFHCHDVREVDDTILDNDLRRGEFYNLDANQLRILQRRVRSNGLRWSIHSPLVKLDWYPHPPTWSFLCDFSPEKRALTMKMVAFTVEQAEQMGAEYVVVHFPTPSGLPQEVENNRVKELRDIGRGSCEYLAGLSQRSGIPIHVEGVGLSPLLDAQYLRKLLAEFTTLRYCFDTAHVYLAALQDGLDYYSFAQSMSSCLGSVHIWNTRGMADYLTHRHIPVHPSQDPRDGWVDIARVLRALDANRQGVALILESPTSYPQTLGDYDYRDGIKWVKRLLSELS
ncbi:MAG: sugar phosphate isomerase/epimerase [Chloroflexi bacterium]|nr:sugar phosphate isomerase/epimerase [Chloroflexota bacterium]